MSVCVLKAFVLVCVCVFVQGDRAGQKYMKRNQRTQPLHRYGMQAIHLTATASTCFDISVRRA